jgi:nucleoside-diphosphate-sugar epimerase
MGPNIIARWARNPTESRFHKNKEDRMTTLVIGSGLIGSQVARILVERGEKPVLMDYAAQPQAIGQIVDLTRVTLIAGNVLRPLSIVDALFPTAIELVADSKRSAILLRLFSPRPG